ncbi:MAG: electron transport complex subunit RsxE [Clostridia bacterium]|nr:electron transport complex subunit RsxE [Clostridia bacterium]
MNNKYTSALTGGLFSNPVFVLVLGTCPTIAKSTNVTNAVGLGFATMFVLVFSNLVISALRNIIPDKVRLPAYIVIIATFVTLVQMFISSYLPALDASIGAFIPLIVVNCIILGRAEAFASKNDVVTSVIDGLSMGLGFVAAITLMGATRQFLAEVLKIEIFAKTAGGFIVFGLLMALFNVLIGIYNEKSKAKQESLEEKEA